jgi:hypothetical protein
MLRPISSARFHSAHFESCQLILELAPPSSTQDARRNAERLSRQKLKSGPVCAYGHRYGPSLKTAASPMTASADDGPFGVIFQFDRGAADHVPI